MSDTYGNWTPGNINPTPNNPQTTGGSNQQLTGNFSNPNGNLKPSSTTIGATYIQDQSNPVNMWSWSVKNQNWFAVVTCLILLAMLCLGALSSFGQGVKQSGWTTTTNQQVASGALGAFNPAFPLSTTNALSTNLPVGGSLFISPDGSSMRATLDLQYTNLGGAPTLTFTNPAGRVVAPGTNIFGTEIVSNGISTTISNTIPVSPDITIGTSVTTFVTNNTSFSWLAYWSASTLSGCGLCPTNGGVTSQFYLWSTTTNGYVPVRPGASISFTNGATAGKARFTPAL